MIGLSLFDSVCLLDWSVYVELLGQSDVKPRGPPLRPHTDQPAVTSQDQGTPVKLERNTGKSQTANSTGRPVECLIIGLIVLNNKKAVLSQR